MHPNIIWEQWLVWVMALWNTILIKKGWLCCVSIFILCYCSFFLYRAFLFPGRFIHNILGKCSIMPTDLKNYLLIGQDICKLHDSGQVCVDRWFWSPSKINGHIYRIDRSLIWQIYLTYGCIGFVIIDKRLV